MILIIIPVYLPGSSSNDDNKIIVKLCYAVNMKKVPSHIIIGIASNKIAKYAK